MKNLILMLIPLFLLSSCNKELQQESSLKKQFKNYIKKNMHDPSSYEFVEIKILLNEPKRKRKRKQDSLDLKALEHWTIGSEQYETVKKYQQEIRDSHIESGYLSEYDKAGIIKYRGINSFGAKVLNKSYIYINSDNEIYKIDGRKVGS